MPNWDVLIVGGGIAGVALGYELASDHRVCVLEMERTLAYHSTGRSAATFLGTYGNRSIRSLTAASRAAFLEPGETFEAALSAPRPAMYIAGTEDALALRDFHAEVSHLTPNVEILGRDDALAVNPILRGDNLALAVIEPGALELDVHALHQGYVQGMRARGGVAIVSSPVVGARRAGGVWVVADQSGAEHSAPLVINAAGAWCDRVAGVFGAKPVGAEALRRTVFMIRRPSQSPSVPMTMAFNNAFYIKPEFGQYLCSPVDETPQIPGDAKPDETGIAMALDAINEATVIDARHVVSSWAGLRTFTKDRTPVVGFDANVEGFYWFAGQGGYGIQTCPALARVGASIVRGEPMPEDVAAFGFDTSMLDPARTGLR